MRFLSFFGGVVLAGSQVWNVERKQPPRSQFFAAARGWRQETQKWNNRLIKRLRERSLRLTVTAADSEASDWLINASRADLS